MSQGTSSRSTRRDFLKGVGTVAAASTLSGVAWPNVHPGQDSTIRLALIGAGGRGRGAADNAMSVPKSLGPVKLHAMVDVFKDKLDKSYETLSKSHPEKVDVPPERRFLGFDGYRKAMDLLKPGDLAIFTTPPAFRWLFFKYAIEKRLHVFMEKPVTVDGPTTRRMLKLAEESKKKNLKVGVGLMCRHCEARRALKGRIKDGQIGDILHMRSYRMQGRVASCFSAPNPGPLSNLMYQIRNFHSFLWLSGGSYSDFFIHNIDECCWMKGAWPVRAKASGGRHYRGNYIDQNFDHYSVEYTFEDGTTLEMKGRNIDRCHQEFASYAHGTKGSAVISWKSHSPAKCRIYKGQTIQPLEYDGSDLAWAFKGHEPNPYREEWTHLIDAIRNDKPYNEVERGAMASLVTSMGRMAAHTGQLVTLDQMLKHEHEFAPDLDKLTLESPSPLEPTEDGRVPIPEPGKKRDREY